MKVSRETLLGELDAVAPGKAVLRQDLGQNAVLRRRVVGALRAHEEEHGEEEQKRFPADRTDAITLGISGAEVSHTVERLRFVDGCKQGGE